MDVDIDSTRWSIIASGEGANRISFLYYAMHKNPAIGDRVLLLNTSITWNISCVKKVYVIRQVLLG